MSEISDKFDFLVVKSKKDPYAIKFMQTVLPHLSDENKEAIRRVVKDGQFQPHMTGVCRAVDFVWKGIHIDHDLKWEAHYVADKYVRELNAEYDREQAITRQNRRKGRPPCRRTTTCSTGSAGTPLGRSARARPPTPAAPASLARQRPQRLTFHYVVQDGDRDEDGISVGENALIGGDIVDSHGNPARASGGACGRPRTHDRRDRARTDRHGGDHIHPGDQRRHLWTRRGHHLLGVRSARSCTSPSSVPTWCCASRSASTRGTRCSSPVAEPGRCTSATS